MPVSAEIAAALAAKYPRLADQAAGAEAGDLVVSIHRGAILSRHREYRMPDGTTVPLDESETPPVVQQVMPSQVIDPPSVSVVAVQSQAAETVAKKAKPRADIKTEG